MNLDGEAGALLRALLPGRRFSAPAYVRYAARRLVAIGWAAGALPLSIGEAAAALGCKPATLYKLVGTIRREASTPRG